MPGTFSSFGGCRIGVCLWTTLLNGTDIGSGFENLWRGFFGWFKPKPLRTVHKNTAAAKAQNTDKQPSIRFWTKSANPDMIA